MPCYHPLIADRVTSGRVQGYLPCGRCVGCRAERARQWAVRCMHEASLHEHNSFVTLTYDDDHLPRNASLDRGAFPRFMKRLRKEVGRVRYFHAGEYGALRARPHYHALLFGYGFPDKCVSGTRAGEYVYRSAQLERLWPLGRSEIGSVTFASAAYVCRYLVKEGKDRTTYDGETGEVIERERSYATMSRNPGLGAGWFERYGREVFPSDAVLVDGELRRPPRYYFERFAGEDPAGAELVRARREQERRLENETRERLGVREKVALAQLNLRKERAVV